MSFDCICPPSVYDTIVSDACKKNRLPKIARVWFQKVETGNNFINGTNGIEEAASFTGLTSAVDSTKLVVTPYVTDVTFGETDAIESDENFDGATTKTAVSAQEIVITIKDPNPDQVASMNSLFCQDDGSLGVFFVTSNGNVICNKVTDAPLTHSGITVSQETLIGSAPSREGALGSSFMYKITLSLSASWYENSDTVKNEDGFNYITDVVGV